MADLRQLRYLRQNLRWHGKLTGFVLQLITSMSKIKMTNSATRVFTRWSGIFAAKNLSLYRAGKLAMAMALFGSAFSVVSMMVFFSLVYVYGKDLSFGHFITFNALFGQTLTSVLSLVSALTSVLSLIPLYERIKPIMETVPEPRQQGLEAGILTGKIDLTHVSFRYSEETPVIFKDLSLSINAGENIAIIGASGCGKSTLFRLLLGLEQPQSGKIYYSNMDLSNLNINSIRKQTGVVLQDSVLFAGSILENIVGSVKHYDMDEINKLMEQVCLAEEIRSLPMGLQTIVTEQGRTLSNGQRQRLLLARALFKKPTMLLLDEATSSLDNITQERIYRHLARLRLTRLVIAHRPSTLRFADRIYVLGNGAVAHSGSFDTLLGENPAFRALMHGQF